jgi:hypothetical protein
MPRRRRRESSADDGWPGLRGRDSNLRRRYEEGSWAVQKTSSRPRCTSARPVTGSASAPSLAVRIKDRTMADYVVPISEATGSSRRSR